MDGVRFLTKEEYIRTLPLFRECFGEDREFEEEYYGYTGRVYSGRIAVYEEAGSILSMAHIIPVAACTEVGRSEVPYIMCVCTAPAYRHRGLMDKVMGFTADTLLKEGFPWCVLIAVDRRIYRHLGYLEDRRLTEPEKELLYAEEDLDVCSIKLLNADAVPERLRFEKL